MVPENEIIFEGKILTKEMCIDCSFAALNLQWADKA